MQRIVAVSGPTASGKSEFAVQLAEKLGGEIISADSVAVYKEFDIGSAKPGGDLLERVPHHLVSILGADEDFNAGEFGERARLLVQEIAARGKVPIVSGGTGLYIRSLVNGLIDDAAERIELEELSQDEAHAKLAEIDPVSAAQIHRSDGVRTKRALEFALRTGKSIVEERAGHRSGPNLLSVLIFVLEPDRVELYRRINERVSSMLACGLIEETQELLKRYAASSKPFSAIGYRHAVEFLTTSDRERLESELSRDTRRFAKRQFTWWRNQPRQLGWREISLSERPVEIAGRFLESRDDFSQDAVYVSRQNIL